jgi:protein tyrosine/serine phosphatase
MTNAKPKIYHNKSLKILVLIAIAAGGLVLWHKVIKDNIYPRNFGIVEDGSIYRSGQISAHLIKDILIRYNIRIIIVLTGEDAKPAQIAEKKAADELNIKILTFPLRGNGTGDPNLYIDAVTALAESVHQQMPVLVHCAAGTQRTGGVIAVYRLLVERKDPAFVISEMKKYGWNYHHNPELSKYLNTNIGLIGETLKQKGVIESVPSPLPKL